MRPRIRGILLEGARAPDSSPRRDGDGAVAARAQHMRETGLGVLDLALSGLAAQLPDDFDHLAKMRGPNGFALADQSAAHAGEPPVTGAPVAGAPDSVLSTRRHPHD